MKMLQDRANGEGLLGLSDEELRSVRRNSFISDVYDVEDTVFARGKFATVRRANHKTTGVQYAAKYIKKRRRAVDMTPEIYHEISVLLKCAPSNRVVRLHEVYETNSDVVLVLELAAGGELQRIFDTDHCLSEIEARRAMRQILEGLCYLHEKNIAHLDLKPQNLLLTVEDCCDDIKLCDFGVSRLLAPGTEVRALLGTPDYVAPEVLSYEPISLATDIWSVGVLAYVLLSGYTPFGGDTKQQTYLNISQCILTFEPDHFGDVSGAAMDFIKSSLLVNPRLRPTVQDLLQHPWISPKAHILPPLSIKTADPISTTPKTTPISQRRDSTTSQPQKKVEESSACDCDYNPVSQENGSEEFVIENDIKDEDTHTTTVNKDKITAIMPQDNDINSNLSTDVKFESDISKGVKYVLPLNEETSCKSGIFSQPSRFITSPEFENVEEFSGPISDLLMGVQINPEAINYAISANSYIEVVNKNVNFEESNSNTSTIETNTNLIPSEEVDESMAFETTHQDGGNAISSEENLMQAEDDLKISLIDNGNDSLSSEITPCRTYSEEDSIITNTVLKQDCSEISENVTNDVSEDICVEKGLTDPEVTEEDSDKAYLENNTNSILLEEIDKSMVFETTHQDGSTTISSEENLMPTEDNLEVSLMNDEHDSLSSEITSCKTYSEEDPINTNKVLKQDCIEISENVTNDVSENICFGKDNLTHPEVTEEDSEKAFLEVSEIENNLQLTTAKCYTELLIESTLDDEINKNNSEIPDNNETINDEASSKNEDIADSNIASTNNEIVNSEELISLTSVVENNSELSKLLIKSISCEETDILNAEHDLEITIINEILNDNETSCKTTDSDDVNIATFSETSSEETAPIHDNEVVVSEEQIPEMSVTGNNFEASSTNYNSELLIESILNEEMHESNPEHSITEDNIGVLHGEISSKTPDMGDINTIISCSEKQITETLITVPKEENVEEIKPTFIDENYNLCSENQTEISASENNFEVTTNITLPENTKTLDLVPTTPETIIGTSIERSRILVTEENLSDDEQIITENIDELFENIYKSQEGIDDISEEIDFEVSPEENATPSNELVNNHPEVATTSPCTKKHDTSKESLVDLGYDEGSLETDDEERFVEDRILWEHNQRSKSFETALKKFQTIEEKEAPKLVKGRHTVKRKRFSTFDSCVCNNTTEHNISKENVSLKFQCRPTSCQTTTDLETSDLEMSPEISTKLTNCKKE